MLSIFRIIASKKIFQIAEKHVTYFKRHNVNNEDVSKAIIHSFKMLTADNLLCSISISSFFNSIRIISKFKKHLVDVTMWLAKEMEKFNSIFLIKFTTALLYREKYQKFNFKLKTWHQGCHTKKKTWYGWKFTIINL